MTRDGKIVFDFCLYDRNPRGKMDVDVKGMVDATVNTATTELHSPAFLNSEDTLAADEASSAAADAKCAIIAG